MYIKGKIPRLIDNNIFCLIMAILLILSFSSCGLKTGGTGSNNVNRLTEALGIGILAPIEVKLSFGTHLPPYANAFIRNNLLYLYNRSSQDVTILSLDPLGKKVGSIKTNPPMNLCVDKEENVWVIYVEFGRDISGVENVIITLEKYDNNGYLIYYYDLSFLYGINRNTPRKILVDDDNNLFILSSAVRGNNITVFDTNGDAIAEPSILCTLNAGAMCDIALLSNGKVVAGYIENSEYVLKQIDVGNKSWGECWAFENSFQRIYSGNMGCLFLDDGINIYKYDFENGEISLRGNCILSGMSSFGTFFTELESGQYLILRPDPNDYTGASTILTLLEEITTTQRPVILKLATMDSFYLKDMALSFNNSNNDVKIEIVDYSVYNTFYGDNTGATRMVTDFIAGNVPDIYDLSAMPVDRLIAQNMLVDLYQFINSDPGISRENYLDNILSACEENGRLYELVPWYYIVTVAGKTKDVGEGIGWTFDEFKQVIDSMPDKRPFGLNLTRYNFLEYALFLNNSELISWPAGKCYFESDYFVDILKFALMLPSNSEELWEDQCEYIFNGEQILLYEEFNSIFSVNRIYSLFQDDITFKGFPAFEGSGNVVATYLSLGISSASNHQNEAWDFVRGFITESYQNTAPKRYAMLPIMASSLDKLMEAHRNEIMFWNGKLMIGDFLLQTYKDPDYDITKAYGLIQSADRLMHNDIALLDIVMEEVEAFFASDKSAEEVAKIIQNRAQTYVWEQTA